MRQLHAHADWNSHLGLFFNSNSTISSAVIMFTCDTLLTGCPNGILPSRKQLTIKLYKCCIISYALFLAQNK